MRELRKNPLGEDWVVIAPQRGKRPDDYRSQEEGLSREEKGKCPFCPGNEKETPPEVFAFRAPGTLPDSPGWEVRVVPNKFAALEETEVSEEHRKGIFVSFGARGRHEVIIEDPAHGASYDTQEEAQLLKVFLAWQERLREAARKKDLKYTQIFKNYGKKAGASLAHPHSQLVSLPLVPAKVQAEMEKAESYRRFEGRCLFCALAEEEKERTVLKSADFVVFCPYFSRFPFETWVLPRRHLASFEEAAPETLFSLAAALKSLLGKMKALLGNPPYNLTLHTLPHGEERGAAFYHWHARILPQIATPAGFEWGTGFFINPVAPEEAAAFLRKGGEGD